VGVLFVRSAGAFCVLNCHVGTLSGPSNFQRDFCASSLNLKFNITSETHELGVIEVQLYAY
jgi:hypothetical protein